tara:strand:+ start:149 stop:592 length:444 start_codon:yes stop_codon:yes gene_type:complete
MGFWFRRRKRRKTTGIKVLRGSPFSNIPRWLYERTKRVKTNPLNKSETTKTKEKKINVPNLQRTLMRLVSTTNQLIAEINKIPALEERMRKLQNEHKKDFKKLTAAIALHAGNPTKHVTTGGSSGRGQSSGRYKKGGKIKKSNIVGK